MGRWLEIFNLCSSEKQKFGGFGDHHPLGSAGGGLVRGAEMELAYKSKKGFGLGAGWGPKVLAFTETSVVGDQGPSF